MKARFFFRSPAKTLTAFRAWNESPSEGSGVSRSRKPVIAAVGRKITSRPWRKGKIDLTESLFHTWRSRRFRPVLSDLLSPIFTAPRARLLVFLLDISDSMSEGLEDLKEVLASSLGRAYYRRDPVAILTVQGSDARLLVHPTTSLHFIMNRLSSLRVGGGTPLDRGLNLVRRTLPQWHDRFPVMDLIILSDGRSTAPLAGPGIERAIAAIRRLTRTVVVVNPISGAVPHAKRLAEILGGSYLEGTPSSVALPVRPTSAP